MIWLTKIIPILKILGIVGIISILGYLGYKIREFHLDRIDQAVESALLKENAEQKRREEELLEKLKIDNLSERKKLQEELRQERQNTQNLQRMLLIEHDLDRLLQQKPGLILPRVNAGTEKYFEELEEATK